MNSVSIGAALFTKTQQRVLGLLYGKPENTFYLNEIVRLAGVGKGTIKRELEKLKAAEILTIERVGNQIHYQANPDCPVFEELVSIVRKASVLVELEVVDQNKGDIISLGNEMLVSRKAMLALVKPK
ncbi:MAG: winged helix-turn-helix transcriptional regulator [Gammaproteobacteria bacterium]|nr:winged helix-turn-helix transcriptional regulator [Gammaproteobacteria bacterium]